MGKGMERQDGDDLGGEWGISRHSFLTVIGQNQPPVLQGDRQNVGITLAMRSEAARKGG